MSMFKYLGEWAKETIITENGVSIKFYGNKKIEDIIKAKCKEYVFGKLEYIDPKYKVEEKDIWYSYDLDSFNFHIVPSPESEIGRDFLGRWVILNHRLKQILINSHSINDEGFCLGKRTGGPKEWVKCHKYIVVKKEEFEYLLSFNTLICSERNEISNKLGKIQFYRYKQINGHINRYYDENNEKKPIMMYPDSFETIDPKWNSNTGHCVYNTEYDINSRAIDIAKAFIDFIEGKIIDFETGNRIEVIE